MCTSYPSVPRFPAAPVAELNGHVGSINGITWAPHSAHHLCSVADDMQALIWDVGVATDTARVIEEPILAYVAPAEINQVTVVFLMCSRVG